MLFLSILYCPEEYSAPSEALLLTHIRIVHANDPGFSIQYSLNGCERMFTNFRTYQNHRLTHRYMRNSSPPAEDVIESDELDFSPLSAPLPTATDMQSLSAKWILKTRETRSLTHTAMQGIIEDVTDLVGFVTHTLQSQTHAILQTHEIDPQSVSGLDDVFTWACNEAI